MKDPQLREMRKNYYIKWNIKFKTYKKHWALLPTIAWQPWQYRWPGVGVIDIQWLIFHLIIGIWKAKEE